MHKLTYTNSQGESIVFSHRPPFILSKFEGLGDVEAEVQRQKSPYQDGSTHTDTILQERFIVLEVTILGNSHDDVSAKREQLSRVLNPKLKGKLVFENGRVTREIEAFSEHVPKFPSGGENRGSSYQISLINLVCPNPFWQDINPTNIKLEDFVANFAFPFSFPVSFATRGDTRVLVNTGHVPTPVKVTFVGESINPKITKINTGEFIKVNRTIPAGYSLVITTDFGNKAVEIIAPDGVATNALGYIDLDTTFFSLDVGENQLSFITEGGQPDVYIEYKNLFVGV